MTSIQRGSQSPVMFQARFKLNQAKVDHMTFSTGTSAGTQALSGMGMVCASDPKSQQFANLPIQTAQLSGTPQLGEMTHQNPAGVGFLSTITAGASTAGAIYLQNGVRPTVPEHEEDTSRPRLA